MARVPFAVQRIIPENATQAHIVPTQLILHVSAGESSSLYYLWTSPTENLESHLYSPRTAQLEQYMDTTVMADANYKANRRPDGTGAISVETQGADANGEWNEKQCADIVRVMIWAHNTHGIPLRLCRDPDDPGVGWHIMWGSPGAWTPVSKVCPGPNRIKQIPGLLARAQAAVDSGSDNPEDLSIVDADTKAYFDAKFAEIRGKVETTFNQVNLRTGGLATSAQLSAVVPTVTQAITDAVAGLPRNETGAVTVDPNTLAAAVADALSARLKD